MAGDIPPYEDTLPVEELRRLVRLAWDDEHAVKKALRDVPDMPGYRVLLFLSSAARYPEDQAAGSRYQREHPGTVAYKAECEAGAGVWLRIRDALRAARPAA